MTGSTLRVLRLLRYGALTDVALALGPGVTVVVGPNEAGKSTTLAALGDLLWGLPLKHPLSALVPRAQVRLSAELEDGTTVVRTSRGLFAPDGLTRAEHPWGADGEAHRTSWTTSYGLDHTALRRGGQEVCAGSGDLAEVVFTAREGQGVHDLLAHLRERADELYKDHRGNRGVAVRRALVEHTAAREAVAAATTRASAVVAAEERVAALREQVASATERELAAARERAGAERQQRCWADAAALSAVRAELVGASGAELVGASGAVLDEAALTAWDEAVAALGAARQAREALADDVARWRSEQQRLVREPHLVLDEAAVTALHEQARAREDDRARAGALHAEADGHERAARAALGQLGADAGVGIGELLAVLGGPADVATQLDRAADEHARLQATAAAAAEALSSARSAAAVAEAGGALPDPTLVAPVAEAVRVLEADGSPAARWREARELAAAAGASRRERLLEAGATSPDGGAPPPPTAEWVSGAGTALVAARSAEEAAAREQDDAREALEVARAAVAEVAVPTVDAEAVAVLRAERDAVWARMRAVLTGAPGTPRDAVTGAGSGDDGAGRVGAGNAVEAGALAGALTAALAAADAGADALLAAAALTARAAATRQALAERTDAVEAAGAALVDARGERERAEAAYALGWEVAGTAAPPVGEAEAVRRALVQAAAADRAVAEHTGRAGRAGDESASWAARLSDLLTTAGCPRAVGAADATALEALLAAARELVAVSDGSREARLQRRGAAAAVSVAETAVADGTEALHRWQERWTALLAAADLPAVLDPVGWASRRTLLAAAAQAATEADRRRAEAAAAGAAWESFAAAAAAAGARHGGAGAEPAAVVAALWARLTSARRDEGIWEDRQRALTTAAADDDRLAHEQARARAAVAAVRALPALAEVSDEREEAAVIERSRRVLALRERESELLRGVAASAGPAADVEELLTTLEGVDAERLDQLARDAGEAAAAAGAARDAARDALTTASLALAQLTDGGSAAARRALEQEKLAALAEVAERYAVAHLQRTVLAQQVQAHADQHASPLLHEAGQLLERLTDGRWVGIAARGGGAGRSLDVVDGAGEHHETSQLSEGTADQVFLALRLAGIAQLQGERARAGRPALPVVLDDALMTFDDARATRALGVCADLGLQVVVLTHHDHLGSLAAALRRPEVVVERLGPPAAVVASAAPQVVRSALAAPRRPSGEVVTAADELPL